MNNRDGLTFTRQIVNVSAGTQDNDVVNVTQLKGAVAGLGGGAAVAADGSITAPSYSVGGTTVNTVGAAVTSLDTRLKTVNDYVKVGAGQVPANVADNAGRAGNIAIGSNAKSNGNAASSATIAIGENALSTGAGSIALATDSNATGSGAVALGLRSSATGAGAVALGLDSTATENNTVSVGNATTKRRIVNMAAGTADNDAVNVSQLKPVIDGLGGGASINPTTGVVTAPTYTIGGSSFNNVGAALGNLDGRVGSLESAGGSGGPGLVERNAATGEITVGNKEISGDINLRDAQGDSRTLTGIKAGTTRTDAVNFGQLSDTATSVAAALGGGATIDASGKVTAPSYSIGGSDYANVGDAFGAVDTSLSDLDGRVGTVEGDIVNVKGDVTNLQGDITNLTNGTVGIVKYDTATDSVNVATDMGGDKVNFAGTDGDRTLAGVKAGVADTDAANFGQLKGTAQSVADGLGGGSVVNADGTISAPSYSIGGSDYANVGDAFGAVDTSLSDLDGRVGTVEGDIVNVKGDVTNLQGDITNLTNGTVGIVKYDTATDSVNVATDMGGDKVNFAGTDGDRTLAGVKAGVADTDAANFGQLKGTAQSVADGLGGGSVVNPDGTITAPSYTVGGTTVTNVGDAITNIDGRTTTNTGDITNLTSVVNNLQAGVGGIVSYDAPTGTVNVASAQAGDTVNFAGTAGDRALTGVKAGVADNDAANVGQLKGTAQSVADGLGGGSVVNPDGTITAPSYSIGGSDYANVGDAFGAVDTSLTNIDARVTTNEGDITNINGRLDGLADGTTGLVTYDAASKEVNVATGKDGDKVNFAGTAGDRTLAGVKAGVADTDAANFGQLKGTAQSVANGLGGGSVVNPDGTITAPSYSIGGSDYANVGDAFGAVDTSVTNIDARVTTNEGDITNINGRLDGLADGTAGLVTYDAASKEVSVATGKDGDKVNFAGTDGDRTLAGVKAGVADTDAANFGQLKGTAQSVADGLGGGSVVNPDGTITAPSYTVGGTTVTNVGDAITNIDGRTTTNTGDITNLTSVVNNLQAGVGGIVSYDAPTGTVNVASAQAGDTVNFAGTAGDRALTGVKAGVADNDAANVGQLKGTAQSVADGLGGGSVVNPDGTITAPSYTVGGTTVTNVGDAITNIDGRTTTNTGDITNLTSVVNNLSSGAAGIVTYDAVNGVVNVAAAQGGNRVSIAGTDGDRVLAGVADGKVEDGSDEAVNGSQLSATNDRVAANETSITNIDGRVTNAEGDITNLTTQVTNLSSGAAGLVTIDATTGNVQVAAGKGGDVVDMEGTDGKRRVGGVANGIDDGDAVTMAQLRAAGAIDPVSGDVLSVLTYDDSSLAKATLGGTNGTVIGNLGNGLIAAGSREAVNGGQLYQMNADWEAKWGALDGRVGTIEQGIADGSLVGGGGSGGPVVAPGTGEGSVAVGDGADAGGTGSVAIGEGSSATGDKGVAVGAGSDASGDNSVAIGAGSSADRDNEFSVGSEGNERIVSNVGAGVRPTDAVNVQQMNDRFEAERKYVDDRFHGVDKRFDRMGAMSSAYAGMAINTAGLSGDNRIGAGVGAQNGRTALAVGYQRILGEKKNVSVSLGGAFSGSDKSVSAGAGYSW